MAKLILSSCDFRNEVSAKCIYENLPKPVAQCRVLYFPNEKATEAKIKSGVYEKRLMEFGFSRENICVFDYFSPSLCELPCMDVIYISGGNTFGTMRFLRKSGADKLILRQVNDGAVYVGGSTGAHIASADIAHVAKYDADTFDLRDYSGLDLFDGIFICHYSADRQEDYENLKKAGKYRVIPLRDEDSFVAESI